MMIIFAFFFSCFQPYILFLDVYEAFVILLQLLQISVVQGFIMISQSFLIEIVFSKMTIICVSSCYENEYSKMRINGFCPFFKQCLDCKICKNVGN